MAKASQKKNNKDFHADSGAGKGSQSPNDAFGVAKVGLGGLFKGIENLIDLAAKLKDSGGQISREGEVDLSHLKEGMKGVFGFSVKTAVGGEPIVEPFGNIRQTPTGPSVEDVREPLTDVFDEEHEIRVLAEMPGINQDDIHLDLKDDILDICAESGKRKYHKEVLLPAPVQPGTMTSRYNNGILEIKVSK
ncbi:MAG: Hsp20/alpha crystallin family protein [Phycisphaerae bacterium]|nr:Hsp20/alpha crystallin family protein [Phycisphaerae bacterium]